MGQQGWRDDDLGAEVLGLYLPGSARGWSFEAHTGVFAEGWRGRAPCLGGPVHPPVGQGERARDALTLRPCRIGEPVYDPSPRHRSMTSSGHRHEVDSSTQEIPQRTGRWFDLVPNFCGARMQHAVDLSDGRAALAFVCLRLRQRTHTPSFLDGQGFGQSWKIGGIVGRGPLGIDPGGRSVRLDLLPLRVRVLFERGW